MTLKTLMAAGVAAIFLSACGGGSNSEPKEISAEQAEKIQKKAIKSMEKMSLTDLIEHAADRSEEIADVLEKVDNEKTANRAIEKIQEMAPELRAAMTRMEEFDESDAKLSLKMIRVGKDFAVAQAKIAEESERIRDKHPELGEKIWLALEEIEF